MKINELGKRVKLKLQGKDRYGRALAFVEYTDNRGMKIFNSKNDLRYVLSTASAKAIPFHGYCVNTYINSSPY